MIGEELIEFKKANAINDKFIYINVNEKIEIKAIKNFKIINETSINIFKKSKLISCAETTIFDATIEEVFNYYQTTLSDNEFNYNNILASSMMNDYLAKKIIDKLMITMIDILNVQYESFECCVFNFGKLKYQNKVIKKINESFKTKILFYM